MMPNRARTGLILAILGICLGVSGLILRLNILAIFAGVICVAGCIVVARLCIASKTADSASTDREVNPQEAPQVVGISEQADPSLVDDVTELPDGRYFEIAFEGRVAAARRHLWPVSVVLLRVGFDEANDTEVTRNQSLQSFSRLMRQTLREADIACRLDHETFGLILEDTSEEGGVWTAERLQIALSHDSTTIRRLVAGVAAYPSHGLFPKDVMVRVRSALSRANAVPVGHGLGQVEVAHVDYN